jgi:hypothetical protein
MKLFFGVAIITTYYKVDARLNIFHNKPVWASSFDPGYDPGYLVDGYVSYWHDGNSDAPYSFRSKSGTGPHWFRIDPQGDTFTKSYYLSSVSFSSTLKSDSSIVSLNYLREKSYVGSFDCKVLFD